MMRVEDTALAEDILLKAFQSSAMAPEAALPSAGLDDRWASLAWSRIRHVRLLR